jgi:hypothetical protein
VRQLIHLSTQCIHQSGIEQQSTALYASKIQHETPCVRAVMQCRLQRMLASVLLYNESSVCWTLL